MAFVPLVPASLNPVMTQALDQAFASSAVANFAGGVIDLSAWVSLTAKIVAVTPNPNTADAAFGTVTASAAGIITLKTGPTDLATVPTGSANLIISGKPTAGDDAQIICRGTLTLLSG